MHVNVVLYISHRKPVHEFLVRINSRFAAAITKKRDKAAEKTTLLGFGGHRARDEGRKEDVNDVAAVMPAVRVEPESE
jgi:hypothetical protein